MTRFELATPRPPDVCATGLRYIPKSGANLGKINLKRMEVLRFKIASYQAKIYAVGNIISAGKNFI